MGERTEYNPGDRAPNDAIYIEVGEVSFHTEIMNPKQIKLKKGERFPDTTNKDRKWKKKSHAMVH
ncbi:YjzC family protein [Paenibacillus marinisediminis]